MTTTPDRAERRLPVAGPRQVWAAVKTFGAPQKGLALAALLTGIAATAVGLMTAPVLGHIVDLVVDEKPTSELTTPIVLLVVIGRWPELVVPVARVAEVPHRLHDDHDERRGGEQGERDGDER